MDIFTFASQFTDWQRLLLFVAALAAIGTFLAAYNYVRSTRIRADGRTAMEKYKSEVDAKLLLMDKENAQKQIEAKLALERERDAIRLKELEYRENENRRNDEMFARYANGIDAISKWTEQSNRTQEGTNNFLKTIIETQSEAWLTHRQNSQRIQELQVASSQGFAALTLKMEEATKSIVEVKGEVDAALELQRQQLVTTNERVDDVSANTRHILAKINELGTIATQLKDDVGGLVPVERINEIVGLAREMWTIVKKMNEQMSNLKKGGTDDLSKASTPTDILAYPTIPRRKSDPSIALPSINPPVVQSGQPDTPMTGKHDTQPLPVTPPPTPAKPTESN